MNTAAESPWSRRRWWGVVLGLFALQVLLLFWFGARGPVQSHPVSRAPQLGLAGPAAADLLTLQDPTLFAQGHPQGFSGSGWMGIPVPEYEPPEWSEPPRWLALDAQQLGNTLRRFVQTNQPFAPGLVAKPEPQLATPEIAASAPATVSPSTLRISGALATRRRQTEPALRAWEHPDLLTNSVVQVLVNAEGNVISQVLLASSGKHDADTNALALARATQFEPLPRTNGAPATEAALTVGTFLFEWQTLPLTPTNTPAGNP